MKTVVKWTQRDYLADAESSGRPQLLTIPYSHYCEVSRWSLDMAGVQYEHRAFLPGQHILPVLRMRICGEEKRISKTSAVQNVKGKPEQRAGETSVPLCALPDGRTVLSDSWDVAEVLGKFAPVPADLKVKLDEELGPLSRQVAYANFLKPANRNVWDSLCSNGGTSWFWWFAGGKVTNVLEEKFQTHDAEEVRKAEDRLRDVFASLAGEAEEREGKLTAGGKPGLADLAMAALAAVVVLPPQYCRGEYAAEFDRIAEQDDAARQSRDAWRATPLGRFTLRMYREHRVPQSS